MDSLVASIKDIFILIYFSSPIQKKTYFFLIYHIIVFFILYKFLIIFGIRKRYIKY